MFPNSYVCWMPGPDFPLACPCLLADYYLALSASQKHLTSQHEFHKLDEVNKKISLIFTCA